MKPIWLFLLVLSDIQLISDSGIRHNIFVLVTEREELKMGKQLVNNIRGMNPLARRGTLLLLALLVSLACLLGPREAAATVTQYSNWATVANGAGNGTVLTVTGTYGVGATSPQRYALLAVYVVNTGATVNTTVSGTWGGVAFNSNTLTRFVGQFGNTVGRRTAFLFAFNNADIASRSNDTLSVSSSMMTTTTHVHAYMSSYEGVEQSAPYVAGIGGTNANTTTAQYTAALSTVSGSYGAAALLVGASGTVSNTDASAVPATAYSMNVNNVIVNASTSYATLASKAFTGTGTTRPVFTHASARDALVGVVLAPVASTIPTTAAGVATGSAFNSSTIRVTAPYSEDSNANNTLLVEYKLTSSGTYGTWQNMSHSVTPYTTDITGLLPSTSYDVRVTYQDADGVTGTATQIVSGITTKAPGVEAYGNWTRVINDATTRATGSAVNLTGSYAVTAPAGSSRFLLVAITQHNSGNTAPAAPTTISYGGTTLTLATTNRATSGRMHTWLYYLKDTPAVMNGASQPLALSWSAGIASTKIDAYVNTFTLVDQTVAIVTGNRMANTTATTAASLSAAMAITANGLAIYVLNDYNITNATIPVWTPNVNWTSPNSVDVTGFTGTSGTGAYRHELAQRVIQTTATTDNAITGTRTSSRYAMSALVLPPVAVSLTTGAAVPNANVNAGDTSVVVDAFTLSGSGTVSSIQVTGNSSTTSSNVAAIRIYRKGDANTTVYSNGVDTLIGSGTFGAVGTTPVSIAVSETLSASTNYIVVYDIATGAMANGTAVQFTGAVTALTPAAGALADSGSTLTLYATTTVGNGAAEPPNARLWKSSAATNIDAFTLKHNGITPTDDDPVTTVTVTLAPQYISGGSGGTISKFKLMEITDVAGSTVYGSSNSATTADIWNVPTTGLAATSTETTYYVRLTTADAITPSGTDSSGTLSGYYPNPAAGTTITARVTAISHSKGTSRLALSDTTSAALFVIDVEKPEGPASATAVTGSNGGEISLSWAAATDANGGSLDPASYIIRRSAPEGTTPNPYCVDGTNLTLTPTDQSNRSFIDTGLIDSFATRYYYRVCAKDAQGNISIGATSYANAKVTSVCTNTPTISLTGEDLLSTSQVIKSTNTTPFKLLISNNDTGTCPDVDFTVTLVNEVNSIHFDKSMGANPETAVAFPTVVTLGTGGAGAPTGKTLNVYVTGRPEANQLELYKFAVQISNPGDVHGAPLTTALNTGILNDMPPIVHNSNNMGKFQYGSWGQTYTCATCHSNSTTNIKGIYQIISTPIGRRNVVFNKTSSIGGLGDAVFSDDTRPVQNVSNNVCSVCHHQTRQHQYSASKAAFNNGSLGVVGPDADEAYNTEHHNARDCVKCHTHNSAFRSIYGTCGDCHGFKASGYSPIGKNTMVKDLTNALGPNPPNYGAHLRHFKAELACAACHSNTNHGLETTAWAGDRMLEMGFTINKDTFVGFNPNAPVNGGTFYGTNNLNQPYVWTAGPFTNVTTVGDYNNSCVTYCHGGWAGNTGAITSPIWVGDGQAACGTCHNATEAAPPTSGSHEKHTATSGPGLGIACVRCHGTYSNYSTSNAHINGNVEWKMTEFPGATYSGSNVGSTGALAPSAAYGTCNTLYCHSDVQGSNGGGTGGPTFYANAKWGDPSTATCGSCHAALPNNTGSHLNHENAQVEFDCHVCHDNGGTTGPRNHANGTVNFQFIGLASNTVYSRGTNVPAGTAYGTCSNSMCHGDYSRSWGTPPSPLPLCEKCHGSATSPNGFYRTQGPDGTLSVYSTGVGVHDIHIQNSNSPRKAVFARFTSFAAPITCNQCHSVPTGPFTAGHIDTPLPAEVPFSNSSSIAHRGDLFGYYSTPTFTRATQTCSSVYCHGAGMHSNRAIDEYAGTTPPVRTNPKFTSPYLQGQNALQQCTGCHALPPAAATTASTHYGKAMNSCSSCHQHLNADGLSFNNKSLHINGIVEGGCDGCHGNPPVTNVVGAPDGLATPAQNALAGGAGAHAMHGSLPLIGNNCNSCHNLSNTAMPSNDLEISFNAFGGQVTTGTFTGYTNSVNGPKWKVTGGTVLVKSNVQAVVCSNLYCHGGGSSSPARAALGGANNTTPDWEGTAICGDCHGVDSANSPTGGSHVRHAQTVAALTCESCHGVTNDNGTHVNAAVSWKLDRANPVVGANATYNNLSSGSIAGLAPHASYQSCNNVYCHSTVQSGNGTGAPAYKSVQWGATAGSLGCSGCHQDMATDAAPTGSHLKHANPSVGMNVPCGYCHQDGGDGTAIHADGAVFVNFTSYVGGDYSVGVAYLTGKQKPAGSAAFGTCATTFCHGTADSPVWGAPGPLACNVCHSAKVDDVSWSGRHKTHYNYSTMPTSYTQTVTDLSTADKYRFNCAHCHDDNVAKHSLKPASDNSAARVFFGISSATPASSSKRGLYVAGTPQGATDNGFKFTAGSCNTSYCHSNGRGGAPLNAALNWISTPTAGSNCLYCHDGKSATAAATTLSGKHDKHMNPLNNAMMGTGNGFNCVDCHSPVITNSNNTTIANKGKHVNAVLNYSGARALKRNYVAGSGSCSTYCHSNGNPNAVVFVSMTGSKVWTGAGTITTCNKCHGRSTSTGYPDYVSGGPNTATSNNHAGHMSGLTDTLACADCHRRSVDTLAINKFRPYSTMHLSGGPNVNFNTAKTNIGSKASVSTVGQQVTCSTVVCHGQGAPIWGTTTTAHQCQKCHGSRTQAFTNFSAPQVAPGYGGTGTDTSMTKSAPTDPRVGAHQRHLLTNVLSAPVKCGECHVTVTAIRSANHWNYSTATLTFNGRATANGHTPSVSRSAGIMQCSNVNCHVGKHNTGATPSPFWNMTGLLKETANRVDAGCTKCHAMPPSSALVPSHLGLTVNASDTMAQVATNCVGCHTNLNTSATNIGNAFQSKTLHVDGIIQYVQNCNSCHDYDTNGGTWGLVRNQNYGGLSQGQGAHYKHIEYLKAKYNVTLTNTDTWTSPAFLRVCGTCHSINEGVDHSMATPANPRSITFGDKGTYPRDFGGAVTFNGNSGTSSAVNPKSCSNLDCHYRTSPIWSTY